MNEVQILRLIIEKKGCMSIKGLDCPDCPLINKMKQCQPVQFAETKLSSYTEEEIFDILL